MEPRDRPAVGVALLAAILLAAGAAAALVLTDRWPLAALATAVAAAAVTVTGRRAKYTEDRRLTFADSAAERTGDAVVLAAVAWATIEEPAVSAAALSALVLGYLATYMRAKATGLGFMVEESLIARGSRIGLVVLGLAWRDAPGPPRWAPSAVSLFSGMEEAVVGRRLFDLAALAAFRLAAGPRAVVADHLRRVLGRPAGSPVVRAATKEAFRSYGRYWYDTFRIRVMPDPEFRSRVRFEGMGNIERALETGRGAVLALPHLGNWDVAGSYVAGTGKSVTAVAELLRPERLFRLFLEHRRALGVGIVPLEDDRGVAEELVRLIGENELIALVADRDLRGRGVEVEMFGETRKMPAGPAMLSLFTGSPLLPAACYDLEDGWLVDIGEPIEIERSGSMRADVTALTRLLAKRFERAISAAPTQWHMFQPAWEPSRVGR